MMEQIKRKYKVFLVGRGEGCYAKDFYRGLLGETWAVSPAKAISNIKYRLRQQLCRQQQAMQTVQLWVSMD